MGQEPFFKHKPSSSEISPPSPPQVNLKSSNAFQILQSDVSEVVAPIEFADQTNQRSREIAHHNLIGDQEKTSNRYLRELI